jgi:hypothetical protein
MIRTRYLEIRQTDFKGYVDLKRALPWNTRNVSKNDRTGFGKIEKRLIFDDLETLLEEFLTDKFARKISIYLGQNNWRRIPKEKITPEIINEFRGLIHSKEDLIYLHFRNGVISNEIDFEVGFGLHIDNSLSSVHAVLPGARRGKSYLWSGSSNFYRQIHALA